MDAEKRKRDEARALENAEELADELEKDGAHLAAATVRALLGYLYQRIREAPAPAVADAGPKPKPTPPPTEAKHSHRYNGEGVCACGETRKRAYSARKGHQTDLAEVTGAAVAPPPNIAPPSVGVSGSIAVTDGAKS